jgi:hypothetical protein
VHTLCAFTSIQITNLTISWVLKFILEWVHLQWLCFTASYPVVSLLYLIEILHYYSNSNMRIWVISIMRIDLFLFSNVSFSTLANLILIPSYQISSWNHLDPMSYPSKYIMICSHIFKLQLGCLSKCDTSNLSFYLTTMVLIKSTIIVLNPILSTHQEP